MVGTAVVGREWEARCRPRCPSRPSGSSAEDAAPRDGEEGRGAAPAAGLDTPLPHTLSATRSAALSLVQVIILDNLFDQFEELILRGGWLGGMGLLQSPAPQLSALRDSSIFSVDTSPCFLPIETIPCSSGPRPFSESRFLSHAPLSLFCFILPHAAESSK